MTNSEKHRTFADAEGLAALGICESLLLELTDLAILSEKGARDILNDVVTTHSEAADQSQAPERHREVVRIIRRILSGENGTPH
jgi:hypothetical protein